MPDQRRLCLHLPHEPQCDRRVLHRLADWAVRFSPLVQPVEPDTLLIDITGCERLFHGEADIARQAVQGLRQQGFQARAAIAAEVFVTKNADAATPSAASCLPALKPNHPNHKRDAPRAANVTLDGNMASLP